jgi:hypothetical protein
VKAKASKGIEDEWGKYNKGYMGNTGRTDMGFDTGMVEIIFFFFLASGRDTIGYGMIMTTWDGFICVYYHDLIVLVMAQP